MSKKIILFLFGLVYLFGFRLAYAGVIINEVQLSPTEERFIELYNQDNSSVDLTGWYIQRKTQNGSNFGSLVSKTYFENKKINANGYFLISRTTKGNSDIVLGNLTLTESNIIQIKNSSGEVASTMCWGDVNDCAVEKTSNPNESQSVQRNNNNLFIVGIPSPGVENSSSSNTNNSNNADTDSDTAKNNNTTQEVAEVKTKTKIAEKNKIKTKITAKTLAFVGIPVEFNINTTGYDNETLSSGKYFFNFGDGDSREIRINDVKNFTHTFFYEGEYNITLEYFSNNFTGNPEATDKITIKVIPVDITISKTEDEKDFFIEIANNTNYEVDLSKWFLIGNNKSFVFPKNMIIEAKKKIILSPKITNFSILDKDSLSLSNPQGETVYKYSSLIEKNNLEPVKILEKKVTPKISKLNFSENNNL